MRNDILLKRRIGALTVRLLRRLAPIAGKKAMIERIEQELLLEKEHS